MILSDKILKCEIRGLNSNSQYIIYMYVYNITFTGKFVCTYNMCTWHTFMRMYIEIYINVQYIYIYLYTISLQTLHQYSTLKRRGNGRFHVVSTWSTREVFVGMDMYMYKYWKIEIGCFIKLKLNLYKMNLKNAEYFDMVW